jgi:nicotinamidase-related amidase
MPRQTGPCHFHGLRENPPLCGPAAFWSSDAEPIPGTGWRPAFLSGGRIWSEIAPLDHEIVIFKPSYGAFYDTPLETILKNLAKSTVVICGTLTNFCCGTTARQAYERGFQVVFGSDITATDDPDMQEPELRVIRKGFGRVMTCEEILNQLQ